MVRICRRGFTLLELLIVVGILVVLASLLIPAATRAREHVRAAVCLSNLRNLGYALLAYTCDNDKLMPAYAAGAPDTEKPWDWIKWDTTEPNKIVAQSALAPYLGITNSTSRNISVLICPSDDVSMHQGNPFGGYGRPPYIYSYALNGFGSDGGWTNQNEAGHGLNQTGYFRITQVINAPKKIMFIDESEYTIDDGLWRCNYPPLDRLAARHSLGNDSVTFLQPIASGNVCYYDGHAAIINRADCELPTNWDPLSP